MIKVSLAGQVVDALSLGNVQAGLRAIRQGESDQTPRAYHRRWPGTGRPPAYFEDLSRHPRILEPGPNGPSSAAGAYQITMSTYDDFAPRLGITTFYEADQDTIAVAIIESCNGALDDLVAGRFGDFVRKCAGRWASFPGGNSGQPFKKLDDLKRVYAQYGGVYEESTVATESATPVEAEQTIAQKVAGGAKAAAPVVGMLNPVAGLALGLVGSLMEVFNPLIREKAQRVLEKRGVSPEASTQVINGALEKVKELAGTQDPVTAVAIVKADPAKVAQVEDDMLVRLTQLEPFIDKLEAADRSKMADEEASRDAAARRAAGDPRDQDVFLTRSIVAMTACVAGFLGIGVVVLMVAGRPAGELLALFGGVVGVIIGKFGTRVDHRYGSSRSSSAKDLSIEYLSKGRQ